jgi:ribokinase
LRDRDAERAHTREREVQGEPMAKSLGGMVIVAGSINVDLIVSVSRLPTAGETVLGRRLVQQNGGKSANQAVAASRVGARVVMLGAVGDDDFGSSALEGLRAEGVDVSACRRLEGEHTGVALIVVDDDGENQIAVASGANDRLDGAIIEDETAFLEPAPGAVCLLGFEVPDAAVVATARWAAGRGLRIILNPAPARPIPPEILAMGVILTPNEREAQALTGASDPDEAGGILAAQSGAPVIVSRGADGALLHADGRARHLPATPVKALDTTGAGDALNGILAAELSRGAPLDVALRWAMAGAALKTIRPGAQAGLPDRDTVAALMGEEATAVVKARSIGP